eukprot:jgi/Bigna1/136507/aug1.34_g11215
MGATFSASTDDPVNSPFSVNITSFTMKQNFMDSFEFKLEKNDRLSLAQHISNLYYAANLDLVMKNDQNYEIMKRHMEGRYDKKLLQMWNALVEIEKMSSELHKKVAEDVKELKVKFISPRATSPVNISEKARKTWLKASTSCKMVVSALNVERYFLKLKAHRQLFCEICMKLNNEVKKVIEASVIAEEEIGEMVERDSFRRFKRSNLWRQCKEAQKKSASTGQAFSPSTYTKYHD